MKKFFHTAFWLVVVYLYPAHNKMHSVTYLTFC